MTEQTTEIETFELPTFSLERLNKEVAKLNRRADRLGFPHMSVVTIREFQIPHPDYVKREMDQAKLDSLPQVDMTEVSLEGDAPKIEGYEFVATLDHYSIPGSVIVRTVPGQSIPKELHDRDATCDHCGKIRRRTETFILREDATGNHIAVGRQCVRDFIGYDVASLARYLQRWAKIRESLRDNDEGWWGSKIPLMYNKEDVLASTFGTIRVKGWKAKSACITDGDVPTSHYVGQIYDKPMFAGRDAARQLAKYNEFVRDVNESRDEDLVKGTKAVEWLDEQEDGNEYIHNLKVLRNADLIPMNMFGFWCSLAAAYERAIDNVKRQEEEKKDRLNEHVGSVSEKIESTVTVQSLRSIDGYYGVSLLHRMIDDSGRTLVWFASTGRSQMEEGGTYRIKGTVKKLDEYKGWKQTVLNRVSIIKE